MTVNDWKPNFCLIIRRLAEKNGDFIPRYLLVEEYENWNPGSNVPRGNTGKVSTNRLRWALKRLAREGLIERTATHIRVLDWDRLNRRAEYAFEYERG